MGGPTRTCVGCRAEAPRDDLLRIARTPTGIVADLERRAPGRGASVHRTGSCLGVALAKGALARALGTGIGVEEVRKLRELIEGSRNA